MMNQELQERIDPQEPEKEPLKPETEAATEILPERDEITELLQETAAEEIAAVAAEEAPPTEEAAEEIAGIVEKVEEPVRAEETAEPTVVSEPLQLPEIVPAAPLQKKKVKIPLHDLQQKQSAKKEQKAAKPKLSWESKPIPGGSRQRLRRKKIAKYSPTYLIGQAFTGLWRNFGMSIASVLVLLACLLTTGSFFALIKNLNYNLDDLGQLNQIVVYLDESYTSAQVEGVQAKIAAMSGVEGASIVTKEQALAEEKQKYAEQYPNLFDSLSEADNPYRDSIVITYRQGVSVGDLEANITALEGVVNMVSRADVADSVSSMKNGISVVFAGFMIVLFVVTLFVIIMTIRLAVMSRSKEIMIMRYVGATRHFIMTPFVLEGVIIGVVSALLAFILQRQIYAAAARLLTNGYDLIRVMPFHSLGLAFLGGFLLIGIVTGAVGSWISLRKYLKV